MFIRLNEQLLFFTLYRATNVVAAFKQFKMITVSCVDTNESLNLGLKFLGTNEFYFASDKNNFFLKLPNLFSFGLTKYFV